MNRWFTSDTHFGHANILKFTAREFETVGHMNENIIGIWNAMVRPVDQVYHLGDFGLASLKALSEVRRRLNGHIHLIRGNHDRNDVTELGFEWVKDYYRLDIRDPDAPRKKFKIALFHYPILIWDCKHYGSWNLHGHCHGSLPDDPHAARTDVGWDRWGRLVEFEELKPIMMKRGLEVLDHHGRR